MPHTYHITTPHNTVTVTGTIVRLKPRDPPQLALRNTGDAYTIDHLPTGLRVVSGLYFQTVARALAKDILTRYPDVTNLPAIISREYLAYLISYQYCHTKIFIPFDEWDGTPTGSEALEAISRDRAAQEWAWSMCEQDITPAWVPL